MIRPAFTIIVVVLETIILGSIAILAGFLDRSGNFTGLLARLWSRIILLSAGVKVKVEGTEHLTPGDSYVFISNHSSLIDIPALLAYIPFQLRILAKKELFMIPIFGQALKAAGHVRVDRGNLESAIESIREASERLKELEASALVFAEGTRSVDGTVGKFKKGGVILAISMGVPMVPVSIIGSRDIAVKKSIKLNSGVVKVVFGKPVETAGKDISDRNELLREVRDTVISNMDKDAEV